jgi:hypothetical protein
VPGPHPRLRRTSAWPWLLAAALALLTAAATAAPPASLLAAAAAGDADAQAELGGLYYRGAGVARDPAAAFGWLRRAAEQGARAAQRGLAVLYYNGEGTPQDLIEALKWALIAARQGDVEAASHRDYLRGRLAPFQVREAERLATGWQPTPEAAPAPKRP